MFTNHFLHTFFGRFNTILLSKSVKILGIDPGTTVFGYAIIELEGKNIQLLSLGVVHLNKCAGHYQKLKRIFEKITFIIDTYLPDEMAIEAPFFGNNVQSMLKLGRAQGVAITAAMLKNLPVTEYSPRKVKQAITGNGSSSKEQVSAMLKSMLHLDTLPKYFDATDALGVAFCHHLQMGSVIRKSSSSGKSGGGAKDWKSFLADNPDRLKK